MSTPLDYIDDTCIAVVIAGSGNPDSPNFGPPEFCENDRLEGREFCQEHLYLED